MLQKLQLLILMLFCCVISDAQDGVKPLIDRFGLNLRSEFIKGEFWVQGKIDDKIKYNPTSGFGLEIGAFYQRKLNNRFFLSLEMNLGYRQFSIGYFRDNFDRGVDYDYLTSIFEIDFNMLTLAFVLGSKMYCWKKHKIYLEVLLGLDKRLNRLPPQDYITSVLYQDDRFLRLEQRESEKNRTSKHPGLTSYGYVRAELLAGIELKKMDISFFCRREMAYSFGIRIRCPLIDNVGDFFDKK